MAIKSIFTSSTVSRLDIAFSVLVPTGLFLCLFGFYNSAPATYLRAFSGGTERIPEYIQATLLIISGVAALVHYKKRKQIGFLIWVAACFFVFLEEISWGQRIFSIETPSFFEQYNVQRETNIHNFANDRLLHSVWISAGIILIIGPYLSKTYFPPKYYILYFLPVVIFYTCFEFHWLFDLPSMDDHQEAAELFLYLGVAQWLTVSLIETPKR